MNSAQIIVIDDFLSDPHFVRQEALKMEWLDKYGNHPGKRSATAHRHPSIKRKLEQVLQETITNWDVDWNTYNGSYNLCKQWDRCWIHADSGNTYAMVLQLTPDAPVETGTALYRHKKTGLRAKPDDEKLAAELDEQSLDFTAWEMTDYVGNFFNRASIYRGELYHSAVQYFGNTDEYCRMHQTFFFSTE